MKNRKMILIGGLLIVLTAVGFFIRRALLKSSACPQRQNVIVFWNNTNKTVQVTFRFSHMRPKRVEVAGGVRACIPVISDKKFQSWDALRYIEVGYDAKRYKFTKLDCLNTCHDKTDCKRSVRYFMVADLTQNDEAWEQVKKKYVEKDKDLDENSHYIVLSNYGKKDSAWGDGACIQVLKTKTYRA